MPKNHKKQVVYCVEHEFSIAPLRNDLYLKQTASLSYCKGREEVKKRGRQAKKVVGHQNCACYPVLNTDRNYSTSTFILPEEQVKFENMKQNFIENSEKLKLEHQQRVLEYNDEKTKILIPKPKTKYSYCSTCKTNYQDYLEHIESDTHKNNINKSKITTYIRDLEKKYQISNRTRSITNKVFQGASTTNQPDCTVEELGRPHKKVKLSQSPQETNNCHRGVPSFQTIQTLNSLQSLPMSAFTPNVFYQNLQYPMEMYPNFGGEFNHMGPYGFSFVNNPYLYWSPYSGIFNSPPQVSGDFNPFKPVVIDLEQQGQ